MQQYRIAAQTLFILSILNLGLAVPVKVQEIYEARGGDKTVMAEPAGDVTATPTPNKPGELEPGESSDKPTSPPPPPSSDAMATPEQHSSLSMPGSSVSSGYIPDVSSASSVSGYSWLLERPPRQSLGGDSPQAWWLESESSSQTSSSNIETPEWLRELEALVDASSSQHMVTTTGTDSGQDRFTPSYTPSSSSLSSQQMSTPFVSASDGTLSSHYNTASEGLGPSHNPIPEASPTPPTSEDAEFLKKSVMKKIKIIAGVTVVGAIITGIAASQIKHRDFQDS